MHENYLEILLQFRDFKTEWTERSPHVQTVWVEGAGRVPWITGIDWLQCFHLMESDRVKLPWVRRVLKCRSKFGVKRHWSNLLSTSSETRLWRNTSLTVDWDERSHEAVLQTHVATKKWIKWIAAYVMKMCCDVIVTLSQINISATFCVNLDFWSPIWNNSLILVKKILSSFIWSIRVKID